MKKGVLLSRWRIALIVLFVGSALWLFAYSSFWLNSTQQPPLLTRLAWSDTATTVFQGLAPSVFLGIYELPDSHALVLWDWGCGLLCLFLAFFLIWRERVGVVLTAVAAALNVLILILQLVGLLFDGGHPYSVTRAIIQRGFLFLCLLGYAALAYWLLRIAVRQQVIGVKRVGPLITIHFLDRK